MNAVLRLSPDLAIVPSMVQSVEIVPIRREIQMGSYAEEPEGYSVAVTYLMAEKPTRVASFPMGPWFELVDGAPARQLEYDERRPSLDECESRAHAVYEEILQAVKDAA